MTALDQYARLESGGLWKPSPDTQRRDVIVSFGEATLVLSDQAERPLTHWSLPAIKRLNPGTRPALFSPDPDAAETLEIDDDTMIEAIEKVRRTITRRRAHPGRLRIWGGLGALALVLGLAVFWLPGAVVRQVRATLPDSAQYALDVRLMEQIEALTGRRCTAPRGTRALAQMGRKLGHGRPVHVVPGELPGPLVLPGGTVVLDRAMVALPDDPNVAGGYILAARTNGREAALMALLSRLSFRGLAELLTTGTIAEHQLAHEAETLIRTPWERPPDAALTGAFANAGVPITPWARDIDITGDSTAALIAQDTAPLGTALLPDGDWLALQEICDG